jgi:hypothetical protein
MIAGQRRAYPVATAGNPTMGLSLIGAMVSSVIVTRRWIAHRIFSRRIAPTRRLMAVSLGKMPTPPVGRSIFASDRIGGVQLGPDARLESS